LDVTLVISKVVLVLAAWMGVFLAAMVGYLTLPAVVLLAFMVLFGGLDLLGRAWRRVRGQ
jgi:hypothetical protein